MVGAAAALLAPGQAGLHIGDGGGNAPGEYLLDVAGPPVHLLRGSPGRGRCGAGRRGLRLFGRRIGLADLLRGQLARVHIAGPAAHLDAADPAVDAGDGHLGVQRQRADHLALGVIDLRALHLHIGGAAVFQGLGHGSLGQVGFVHVARPAVGLNPAQRALHGGHGHLRVQRQRADHLAPGVVDPRVVLRHIGRDVELLRLFLRARRGRGGGLLHQVRFLHVAGPAPVADPANAALHALHRQRRVHRQRADRVAVRIVYHRVVPARHSRYALRPRRQVQPQQHTGDQCGDDAIDRRHSGCLQDH